MTFLFCSSAFAITGFTYSGRILDSNNAPVTDSQVYFTATIYDHQSRCALYTEQRLLDLSSSSGTFSFDIGSNDSSLVGGTAAFNNGITSLADLFNNGKSFTGLNGCISGPNTYSPSATSPRVLGITFKVGALGSSQALPALTINPVPTSFQAFEVDGYGSGALLKVASTVDKTTNPNSALDQAKYDEFWRLVNNPLAAYLPTSGEVNVVSGSNKIAKILGQAVPATAPTSGQVLVSNGTAWVYQTLGSGSVTGVTATAPVVAGGTATAPVISMPKGTAIADGYLDKGDFATFAAKQSSALADGKIWVGNASSVAAEVTMSGDATISNAGALTLASTITAGAGKGTAQKVPQITYDAKGRLTTVTEITIDDSTKLPLAGGTMTGAIAMGAQDITNTGNITMAANKYLGLSANTTNGTVAGQMWYDTGVIKYFDGTVVKSLGVAGAGITSLNGLSGATQTFAIGTAGTAPAFNSATTIHTLDIPMASTAAVTAGLLSKTDYDRIGKAESLNGKAFDSIAATTMGQILFYDSVADKFKVSAAAAPTDGQVLKWNNTTKVWEPGTDAGGWTTVDSSYAAKGIVQFNTDAATSGITVAAGVATVLRTTTGTANTIMSTDNFGVANGYGFSFMGSVAGTTLLKAAATASNYTLTLPGAAPTAGQSLQSDASGNFSWVTASSTDATKLPLAGGTLTGTLTTDNVTMAANKYLGLSANSTNGTVAGQMWYDAGTIKYFDGTVVKSLGVAGAGITGINGLSGATQTIAFGTAGTTPVVNSSGTTHTLDIPMASTAAVTAGLISKTDYDSFAAKQSSALASAKVWVGNASGVAMPVSLSGDATVDNAGAVTLKNTGTAGTYGSASLVPIVTTDAQGRVTGVTTAAPLDATKLPLAGGTMTGAIAMGAQDITNTGNITMAANKYLGLSANTTNGTVAGQMWYDAGTIKYFDGTVVKSLGVAGAGITSLNGLSGATQTFAIGTAGTAPAFNSATTIHTLDIPMASTASVTAGLLSKIDYDAFSAKQSTALNSAKVWVGNGSNIAAPVDLSGDVTITNAGVATVDKTQAAAASKILQLTASSVAVTKGADVGGAGAGVASIRYPNTATNTTLTLPGTVGTANQYLQTDGAGNLTWAGVTASLPSLANTKVWVGNGSSVAMPVSLSGDATIDNAGVVTVDKSTTGEAKILALDGAGVGTMYGTKLKAPSADPDAVTLGAQSTTDSYTLRFPSVAPAAGQTLQSDAGGLLSWVTALTGVNNSASLTSAKIWVGNASNKAMELSLSGDATIDNAGVVTVDKTASGTSSKILALDGSGIANAYGVGVKGATSGTVTLQAPATFTNYSLTLPVDDGTANQVLKTDGSGVLSWVTPSSTDATKLPLAGGTMSGDIDMGGHFITNISLPSTAIYVGSSANLASAVYMTGDATISDLGVVTVDKTQAGVASKILQLDANSVANSKGVNVTNTQTTVYATSSAAVSLPAGGSSVAINNWANTSSSASYLKFNAYNASSNDQYAYMGTVSTAGGGSWTPSIVFGQSTGATAYSETMRIHSNNNVGIGATAPVTKLDVSGVTRSTGFDVNATYGGSQVSIRAPASFTTYTLTLPTDDGTSGDVLTTNGSGVLSWAAASGSLPSLTSAKVWVGNGSNVATAVDLTGDVTITNAGVTAIGASKVTSSMINNGTIVDADINASAAIARSKIASGTNYALLVNSSAGAMSELTCATSGYVVTWNGTQYTCAAPTANLSLASAKILVGNSSGVAMPVSMSSDATISNTGAVTVTKTTTGTSSTILSLDGSGIGNMFGAGLLGSTSGTITMRAPATTANYTATWPNTAGSNGQVLTTNGSGTLSWSNANGSPTVAAKTADFTVGTSEDNYVYLISNATTATLPSVASVATGFRVTMKRIGASNVNILPSGAETIDGATQKSLQANYQALEIMSTGSQWIIISGGATTTSSGCTPGSQAYNSAGTFTYTISAAQATNCTFTVTVKGGGGGNSNATGTGGKGGASQFVYIAPAAGTFEVLVGGAGGLITGGSSGGGAGGAGATSSAGGGGGASGVRYANSTPTNTLLAISGGGGGGGNYSTANGGNGGSVGAGANGTSVGTERGVGGNNNTGGATGAGSVVGGAGGSSAGNGTAGNGATGGAAGSAVAAFTISGGGGGAYRTTNYSGGGGGGGYGGGGGGSCTTTGNYDGGGGGGGGYINSAVMSSFTDITTASGTAAQGTGSVLIEWN
jgi:hypothetical protein